MGKARIPLIFFALGAVLVFAFGCAASNSVESAEKVLDQARGAHADYLAPYHFASAEVFLAQARSQFDDSDFDTAKAYAARARSQAQKAYEVALAQQTSSPIPPDPPFVQESIVLVSRPRQIQRSNLDRAKAALDDLDKKGGRYCAPREFATAEAFLTFAEGEWAERDYNASANYLRDSRLMMEQALPFVENCDPNKSRPQVPETGMEATP